MTEFYEVILRFFRNSDFKNGFKNEFRVETKKYAADSKIEFLKKSILKPFGFKSPFRQRGS